MFLSCKTATLLFLPKSLLALHSSLRLSVLVAYPLRELLSYVLFLPFVASRVPSLLSHL